MKHDNTAKPLTRTHPTGTHPALLTDAEACETTVVHYTPAP
ncbi:hypothetical protein ACWGK1_28740 [Streptomyces wedmorensis]